MTAPGERSMGLTAPGERSVDLADLAGMVAGYRQVELDVFGLLCRWSREAPEPEVKVLLSVHGRVHGEHAMVWEALLASVAPGPPPAFGAWESMAVRQGSAERIAGIYRVLLPALVAGYRRWEARLPGVSGAAVARALRRMTAEDGAQVAEGERLLGTLAAVARHEKEELGRPPSNQTGTG
ncbi:MAG: hypothetical protein ACRDZW_07710 [Acidimicrobiales bacterium]